VTPKGLRIAGGIGGLGLLGVCVCAGWPLELLFDLAIGWLFFLFRVVPELTVSAGGVLMAVVCLAALAWGLHAFLRWFFDQTKPVAEQRWRVRWTLAILGVVVLMFVAGIAATGMVHQTGWLSTSPEPLTEGGMRSVANRMASANNLKQIGLALHDYHSAHQTLPAGGTFDRRGKGLHGWQAKLLPFVEHHNVFTQIHFDQPWDHPDNAGPYGVIVRPYLHPAIEARQDQAGYALSHYAANVRLIGGDVPRSLQSITDGTSNTLLAGEAAGNYKPWGSPTNWRDPALGLNRTPDGFGSPTKGGAQFLFADGSVHFLTNKVSPEVLKAMSTPDGGETLPKDWLD
jgi:prepilin-type processing-associated H-X9-DG protein